MVFFPFFHFFLISWGVFWRREFDGFIEMRRRGAEEAKEDDDGGGEGLMGLLKA